METKELRPITFNSYSMVNGRQRKNPPMKGYFHRFIDDVLYVDENSFAKTWALVESEDGQMYKVESNELKFEDR